MKNIERTLSIIASLITIANFLIIFPHGIKEDWLPVETIASMEIPTKLVLVTVLELALAYAFGRAFSLTCRLDDLHRFLVFMVVAFCSAWLSVFNLEVLLVGKQASGFLGYLGFFGMLVIAWFVAAVMIDGHIKNVIPDAAETESTKTHPLVNEAIAFQGIAYLFIFVSLLAR